MTYFKNTHLWILGYLKTLRSSKASGNYNLKDIIFTIVDHFEPFWENDYSMIEFWKREYPRFAARHYDSDGYPPQHTWFFPIEQYDPVIVEKLSHLCNKGYGEIEIHLHHENDDEESLRTLLRKGIEDLTRHGTLKPTGKECEPRFAFIHGNWALDNSRKDGSWCGVNDELRILKEEGCYADFTLPSAPSETQTRKINSIYYANSNPRVPKAHDRGVDVRVAGKECGHLMIIQGPLTLNWRRRKGGMVPHIENSEISCANPGTRDRIRLWEKTNIHVKGRPEWVFIKVHCHGGDRKDLNALLGTKASLMYQWLEHIFRMSPHYRLHYVTARECYNIVKAAEAGEVGNPNDFRNYSISPPENRGTIRK
ncbi:MAG: hypothetical protein ACFFCW_25830 [Candidatus Hodarchaeota archaeon]